MGKGKTIVKISSTSLERVSSQISIVNKILSKRLLRISPTRNTPQVYLDEEGIISIRGRSIPVDALLFFKPIEEWIRNYISTPADITQVDINLEKVNADSIKFLAQIIQYVSYLALKHKKYIINWYYEVGNEDIMQVGESISAMLDLSINFKKLSEAK